MTGRALVFGAAVLALFALPAEAQTGPAGTRDLRSEEVKKQIDDPKSGVSNPGGFVAGPPGGVAGTSGPPGTVGGSVNSYAPLPPGAPGNEVR